MTDMKAHCSQSYYTLRLRELMGREEDGFERSYLPSLELGECR